MKKVLYLVFLLLPSMLSAQSAGRGRSGDRLLLPTTYQGGFVGYSVTTPILFFL